MTGSLFEGVVAGAERAGLGAPAVSSTTAVLSFGDLLDGARSVASWLTERGVGHGHRVGVWMEKAPQTVQVLLGILGAGAAYVALDPKSPAARCAVIAKNAQLSVLFVGRSRTADASEVIADVPACTLVIDGPNQLATTAFVPLGRVLRHAHCQLPKVGPDDPAYILYTSGSTGTPKGVLHTHGSALAFVDWVRQLIRPTPEDVFSSHAPFHFDLSISDLYASLSAGAQVILFDSLQAMMAPWLSRKVRELGITVWYSVPSVLVSMMEQGALADAGWPSLRVLFFAGEVFPTPQLRRLRAALPHVALFNLYGPTETNVCTYWQVPSALPAKDAPIPIGAACEHMETFALRDDGRVAGRGEEGILWALGPNLMSGYFRPDGTSGVGLKPDPRGGDRPAYDTGDRVRVRRDGGYDFLGRRDHQIKARGHRIELGEIETAVLSNGKVLEAVAWAVPDARGGNRLAISAVPRNGVVLDEEAIRGICAARLPTYMVPEIIDLRPELPKTSTGKADRKALLAEWEGDE